MGPRNIPLIPTMNRSAANPPVGTIHALQDTANAGSPSLNWLTNCHMATLAKYAAARTGKAISAWIPPCPA